MVAASGVVGPHSQTSTTFDTLEEIAWEIVNAAYDEYGGDDLRATAESGSDLQRVIVELANSLRHYHYDGDDCFDEAENAAPEVTRTTAGSEER